jgi:hypothetical protein
MVNSYLYRSECLTGGSVLCCVPFVLQMVTVRMVHQLKDIREEIQVVQVDQLSHSTCAAHEHCTHLHVRAISANVCSSYANKLQWCSRACIKLDCGRSFHLHFHGCA